MKVAGLFAGIGGVELPFVRAGHTTALLCDWWTPSQKVLEHRFPGVPIVSDVAEVAERGLPSGTDVLTAGFPCTDLSQAGRTRGIKGEGSGQVQHVFRILEQHPKVTWLVLENVRNMLVLDKGSAMRFLSNTLSGLGFRWAYRLVDSRFTGVPQRRQRVILVASRTEDPRRVLFADDHVPRDDRALPDDAFGFYWTEGLRGLGWARDAVPTLKGGSTVGIPSPPGIWVPSNPPGRRLIKPRIEDAEALQGFPRGWTAAAENDGANGPRWKLVGNAVTTGVTRWLVDRLENLGDHLCEEVGPVDGRWPTAAWGDRNGATQVAASLWPLKRRYRHLLDLVDPVLAEPISHRGARGFWERTQRSTLNFDEAFLVDIKDHVECTAPS